MKKVCYKVSLCKNCQRQSYKSLIGLTNRAKMIGGGEQPLVPEILDQSDRVGAKSSISALFSLVYIASAVTRVKTVSDTVVRHSLS